VSAHCADPWRQHSSINAQSTAAARSQQGRLRPSCKRGLIVPGRQRCRALRRPRQRSSINAHSAAAAHSQHRRSANATSSCMVGMRKADTQYLCTTPTHDSYLRQRSFINTRSALAAHSQHGRSVNAALSCLLRPAKGTKLRTSATRNAASNINDHPLLPYHAGRAQGPPHRRGHRRARAPILPRRRPLHGQPVRRLHPRADQRYCPCPPAARRPR
jgi:hypothetical protein